jgi:hypothetical protein
MPTAFNPDGFFGGYGLFFPNLMILPLVLVRRGGFDHQPKKSNLFYF